MTEILAPVGSFECLTAAIKAGAQSIYFGVGNLHMRSHARKFSLEDMKTIVERCHKHNIRAYLTVNSVMYDNDIQQMHQLLDLAKENKVDAIIACDIAVIQYAKKIHLPIHISTQANISNSSAVEFYAQYADAVVLARELTLEQIRNICTHIKENNICGPSGKLVRVEIFVHGALCVSVSGKCYMSLHQYNSSANRGACLQACRRKYTVTDDETGDQLNIDNKYVMSPKDLCILPFMERIMECGAEIFKIEGRARPPEYVYAVTNAYKKAADAVKNNNYTKQIREELLKQVKKVYNRDFWYGGYYMGIKMDEWANAYGSQATTKKQFIGTVKNYYAKPGIVECQIQSNSLQVGDTLLFTGNTTYEESTLSEMKKENQKIESAQKCIVTFPGPKVRKGDQVYAICAFEKKQTTKQ